MNRNSTRPENEKRVRGDVAVKFVKYNCRRMRIKNQVPSSYVFSVGTASDKVVMIANYSGMKLATFNLW